MPVWQRFVVASNTLLRPMVNIINRQPLTDERGDATYEICVIALENDQREALTLVKQTLKAENCFMSHLDVEPFGDDDVEITVALIPASVSADDWIIWLMCCSMKASSNRPITAELAAAPARMGMMRASLQLGAKWYRMKYRCLSYTQ